MRVLKLCSPIVLAISLTACSHLANDEGVSEDGEAGFVLTDSSWELSKIVSNGADTTQVDPGQYTLTIRADGTAAFGLDCNRGFGRWKGAATGSADSGTIRFSEMGTTRALCPPGSISDQVAADLERIGSFQVAGSQLILTTDGEDLNYHWEAADENSDLSRN